MVLRGKEEGLLHITYRESTHVLGRLIPNLQCGWLLGVARQTSFSWETKDIEHHTKLHAAVCTNVVTRDFGANAARLPAVVI